MLVVSPSARLGGRQAPPEPGCHPGGVHGARVRLPLAAAASALPTKKKKKKKERKKKRKKEPWDSTMEYAFPWPPPLHQKGAMEQKDGERCHGSYGAQKQCSLTSTVEYRRVL